MPAKRQPRLKAQDFDHKPVVYLLHFTQPVGNSRHSASHYMGKALRLPYRLKVHRRGDPNAGSHLTAALMQRGGDFKLARVWLTENYTEAGVLEKQLKKCKAHARLCPLCGTRDSKSV